MIGYISMIALLGALIFIHEAGHFIAGRWMGIPIRTFSLGFGPRIVGFKKGGTDFRISAIPFGGYVLPEIDDMETFHNIPVKKRIVFSLGGPAMNIICVPILFTLLNVMTSGPSFMNILILPWAQSALLMAGMLISFFAILTDPGSLSGVVGMVSQGGGFIGSDITRFVQMGILLSMNLAVFNLLPIPILDGGKIVMYALERMSVRTRRIQVAASIVGLVLMLALMVYTTVLDVVSLVLEVGLHS